MSHYVLPDPSLLEKGGAGPHLLSTVSSLYAPRDLSLSGKLSPVRLGDVLPFVDGGPLDVAVGFDFDGKPVHIDLAELGSLLVSGTTAAGKTTMLRSIITSILMRATPDEVRLILVDPKKVELGDYDGIPHLLAPRITDARWAVSVLRWCVAEMDRRLKVFADAGVRDLSGYNDLVDRGSLGERDSPLERLPSIVMVVDELTDLIMSAQEDAETSIVRIARLGRTAGVHLVLSSQSARPDIVTEPILAGFSCHVALKRHNSVESKRLIGRSGAELLRMLGDMLLLLPGPDEEPRHVQGCYQSQGEIQAVVEHWRGQPAPCCDAGMAPLDEPDVSGEEEPSKTWPGRWSGIWKTREETTCR